MGLIHTSRVRKLSLWVMPVSALLGVGCFAIHALTISCDENTGMVHEPFFFMVVLGYVFFGVSLVSLVILTGVTIFSWLSRY